jgi:hypothetical protein
MILGERGITVTALSRRTGVHKSHLSRGLRHAEAKVIGGDLAGRIALELGLPVDYWPEYREAVVVERVQSDATWRDRLYDCVSEGSETTRSR